MTLWQRAAVLLKAIAPCLPDLGTGPKISLVTNAWGGSNEETLLDVSGFRRSDFALRRCADDNLFGNAGRNILIGPGLVNLDFSVFKNNYIRKISENFNIQFRWEIFNILNRTNFAVPSSAAIFDAAGVDVSANDIITSTQTPSRQMQVALKVIF